MTQLSKATEAVHVQWQMSRFVCYH